MRVEQLRLLVVEPRDLRGAFLGDQPAFALQRDECADREGDRGEHAEGDGVLDEVELERVVGRQEAAPRACLPRRTAVINAAMRPPAHAATTTGTTRASAAVAVLLRVAERNQQRRGAGDESDTENGGADAAERPPRDAHAGILTRSLTTRLNRLTRS